MLKNGVIESPRKHTTPRRLKSGFRMHLASSFSPIQPQMLPILLVINNDHIVNHTW